MREIDIRRNLNKVVLSFFPEDPNAVVVNEFGICQGEARIDLVVINGYIHGFEIKSENDTLKRLPSQQGVYNRVLDTITVVTGDKYVNKVQNCIPNWWGVIRACQRGKAVNFEQIRLCKSNPNIDPYSLAQLLWHSEALSILEKYKLVDGLKSKPRHYMWSALARKLPLEQLAREIRETLKKRESLKKRGNLKSD